MPFVTSIERSGFARGETKGEAKGKAKGKTEGKTEVARKMLKKRLYGCPNPRTYWSHNQSNCQASGLNS